MPDVRLREASPHRPPTERTGAPPAPSYLARGRIRLGDFLPPPESGSAGHRAALASGAAKIAELRALLAEIQERRKTMLANPQATHEAIDDLDLDLEKLTADIGRLQEQAERLAAALPAIEAREADEAGRIEVAAGALRAAKNGLQAEAAAYDEHAAACAEFLRKQQTLFREHSAVALQIGRAQRRGNSVVADLGGAVDFHQAVCLPKATGAGAHFDGRIEMQGFALPYGVRAFREPGK